MALAKLYGLTWSNWARCARSRAPPVCAFIEQTGCRAVLEARAYPSRLETQRPAGTATGRTDGRWGPPADLRTYVRMQPPALVVATPRAAGPGCRGARTTRGGLPGARRTLPTIASFCPDAPARPAYRRSGVAAGDRHAPSVVPLTPARRRRVDANARPSEVLAPTSGNSRSTRGSPALMLSRVLG